MDMEDTVNQEEQASFGARLKQFREQKGLKLKAVSSRSGLSIGFISQVERDQTDPSLASLRKIADALDIHISDIFKQDMASHSFQKKGEGVIMLIHNVRCELLATINDNRMEPVIKYIDPHSESGQIDPHEGEEFVYVKKGTIAIYVGGNQYNLSEGDSIYFVASEVHGWKNDSAEPVEVLWIITPRIYT